MTTNHPFPFCFCSRLVEHPATYFSWEQQQNKHLPLEQADREALAFPNSVIRQMLLGHYKMMSGQEPQRYAEVAKAGFQVDPNVDIWNVLCGRQGGHYVDIGTSKKIGDGTVSERQGTFRIDFRTI